MSTGPIVSPPDTFTAAVGAGIASSKTYGSLSVFTQLHCDVRLAFRVPPGAFRHPPKVDSGVLHLRVLREPRVRLADVPRFEKVVRAAFAQRRKMLANALGGGRGLPLDVVRRAAAAAGVDPTSLRMGGPAGRRAGRTAVGDDGQMPALSCLSAEQDHWIRYRVRSGLLFFSDQDELYWNATGTDWPVPVDAAAAEVTLPAGGTRPTNVACYTGALGTRERACMTEVAGERTIIAATRPLRAREGLTVVVGIPKGLVREPSALRRALWRLRDNDAGWMALPVLALASYPLYARSSTPSCRRSASRSTTSSLGTAHSSPPIRARAHRPPRGGRDRHGDGLHRLRVVRAGRCASLLLTGAIVGLAARAMSQRTRKRVPRRRSPTLTAQISGTPPADSCTASPSRSDQRGRIPTLTGGPSGWTIHP